MSQDVFTLKCDKLDGASFVGFRGTEHVSKPYEFELFFTVPTGTPVRGAVGERATIRGERTNSQDPFVLHGVLASVRLLHQTAERALYRALLVPRVWLLQQSWRSYVFTRRTGEEFLTDTLKAGGLNAREFRFDIQAEKYPNEEFVAQYRETHLAFLHRWLEREGLYYYFEHKAEADHEVMVIVDDLGRHRDCPGGGRVSYVPLFGEDVTAPEGLHQLDAETRWLPKSVTIADYNYANPSASLKCDGAVSKTGHGSIEEYGVRTFDEKNIKRLAEVRAQAIGCRETMLRASGDVLAPRAGYRFAIDERPEELEEKWLALEVEHVGAIAGMTPEVARLTKLSTRETYQVRVVAIPSSVQYRAPQDTPWPRIYGFENAVVCGEAASQYAQLDKEGRYLVRFEFDTSDLPDGKASTRVRMLQPHGGEKEGFHFPLRKGTEVMIGFLGGDPDRPFIAGVVPNAHKPSVVGERNHTQSVIRSGSGNQIVLEDDAGKEFVFISTPNNKTGFYMGNPAGRHESVYTGERETFYRFIGPEQANPAAGPVVEHSTGGPLAVSLYSEGNAGLEIGGNFWTNVDQNLETFVIGNVGLGYRGTHTLHIGKDSTENYYAKRTTVVTAGQEDTINGTGLKQTIAAHLDQTVNGKGDLHVTEDYTQKLGANWSTTVTGNWNAKFAAETVKVDALAEGLLNVAAKKKIDFVAPSVQVRSTEIKLETAGFCHYQDAAWNFGVFGGETFLAKEGYVGVARSATGVAIDSKLVSIESETLRKASYGDVFWSAVLTTLNYACRLDMTMTDIWSGVFKKT